MKRLTLFIAIVILASCAQKEEGLTYNPKQLPAPVLRVDESIVRWDAIAGVTNYVAELNDKVFGAVAENFLDLKLVGAGEYTVRIKAAGDGRNYADSPWSSSVVASAKGGLDKTEIKITQSTFKEAYEHTAEPPKMTWKEVAKADGYIIRIDGNEVATVTELQFDLSLYPGIHKVSVQAYSGDRKGVHSLSEEISRTVTIKSFGSGSETDPWMLYDSFDWTDFSSLVNAKQKFTSNYVSIYSDIDFKKATISSVGLSSTARFEGVLDGNGHILKNAVLGGDSATQAGFFLALNGTVKNMAFDSVSVTMASTGTTKGSVISGGDTGPDAKILNCSVKHSSISCRGYGSMIAACVKSGANEIKSCLVDSCAIVGSDAGAGAVVGYLAYSGAKVVDCVVRNCRISAKGSVGSIVGTGNMGYMINCIAENDTIVSVSNTGTGALVGSVATTASGFSIVNNLSKNCYVRNEINASEAYLSLLLGKESVTAGKIQNNVVASGKIMHVCTTKPRIGFFVGTKGAGLWDINYYNNDLVTSANQGCGGNLGPIGTPDFEGAKTGGSVSVGTAAGEGIDVVLSNLVTTLNANIATRNYSAEFPEIRNWVSGTDGWPTFEYNNQ